MSFRQRPFPALFLLLSLSAMGWAAAQTPAPLLMQKDGEGAVTPVSLEFVLRARAGCDATDRLIPDGSRLVSRDLRTSVDASGRGVFRGSATVDGPDGRVLLTTSIHGLIGLSNDDSSVCTTSGHLEAMLDPVATFREDTAIVEAHLSADLVPGTAGPIPLYRAVLSGFVTPSPVTPPVSVRPDRDAYLPGEVIAAVVTNLSGIAIAISEEGSGCTAVRLEFQLQDGWGLVSPCASDRRHGRLVVAAGATAMVLLPPSSSPSQEGNYRLALDYRDAAATGGTSAVRSAFSAPFSVFASPAGAPLSTSIVIALGAAGLASGDPVVARVSNAGEKTFETSDHRSFCSILTLRQLGLSGWESTAPCETGGPTSRVLIPPAGAADVTLPTVGTGSLRPGTYRLELDGRFLDSRGSPVEPPVRAVSHPFPVWETRASGSEQGAASATPTRSR